MRRYPSAASFLEGVWPLRPRKFFFFSSRRRHTMSGGDWSSDVCSSDVRLSSCIWNLGFFSERCTEKLPLRVDSHSQAGVRRGVRASGSYQEGTGKSGSYGMWNHPRGHVWNVFGDRPHPEVRPEGREPLPDKAGESTLLSRSGGEKGLRGGGAGQPQCSSRGRPRFRGSHVVFLELRRDSRVTTGNSGCLLCWPGQVQSSIRVAKESWGLLSSDCRANRPHLGLCPEAELPLQIGRAH